MEMHQAVILTSTPMSKETLQQLFRVLHAREKEAGWHGTIFKLEDPIDVTNTVSQIEIESLYGRIAS